MEAWHGWVGTPTVDSSTIGHVLLFEVERQPVFQV